MEKLEKKSNLFTSDDITIKCPKMKKWKDMQEVKDGRFCDGCNEKLYYVGGYTKEEVKSLQRKYGNNICVGVGKTLVTASLAFGLAACSGKTSEAEVVEQVTGQHYDESVVVGLPVLREPQEKDKSIK